MIPPTSIDGTDITGATIDGTDVTEITVDGQTVFTARGLPLTNLVHQYDASLSTNETDDIPDQIGSDDLTGSGSGFVSSGQNGLNYIQYSNGGSSHGANFASTLSGPVTISAAFEVRNRDAGGISDEEVIWDGRGNTGGGLGIDITFGTFEMNQGFEGDLFGPSNVPENQWLILTWSEGADVVRIDGTTELSGWSDGIGAHGMSLNHDEIGGSGRGADWNFGEVLVYDENSSISKIQDIEQYLADKWGITI
jgi:hypothetical protein